MGNDKWHLSKSIPIAVILTIITGFVTLSSDVRVNATSIENKLLLLNSHGERIRINEVSSNAQAVTMGRVEEQLIAVRNDIGRLIVLVERHD